MSDGNTLKGNKDPISLAAINGFNMEAFLQKAGVLKGSSRSKEIPAGNLVFRKLDDRTTAQLQAQRFSGIRANELWNRFEIWILGSIATRYNTTDEAVLTYAEFFIRPQRLNELYCEVFGIDQMNYDAKTQADIRRLEERRDLLSQPELQKAVERLEDPSKTDAKD